MLACWAMTSGVAHSCGWPVVTLMVEERRKMSTGTSVTDASTMTSPLTVTTVGSSSRSARSSYVRTSSTEKPVINCTAAVQAKG